MHKKFKPCCASICMVYGCKIQKAGGCYCICRLVDHMNQLKRIVDGDTRTIRMTNGGCIAFGDKDKAEEFYQKLSEEDKKYNDNFIKQAPAALKELEDELKKYEIQQELEKA
jgi:hypothetical protein